MESPYKYKRVLLKFSGEALKGAQAHGYSGEAVAQVVEKVKNVIDCGIEVALVVGAGNIWRGVMGASGGMDRVHADYMGMLATVMNGLCLKDAFDAAGIAAEVQTSIPMEPIAPRLNRDRAIKALESGKVVIFAGGTGSPFFTTDTTAVLRALETDCEAVLKATKVDGVYSADPFKDPTAERFETLSFEEALTRKLAIMDSTAFSMCRDNDLPILVFNFSDGDSLEKVLQGDTSSATLVHG
jgi:uridylate kinase